MASSRDDFIIAIRSAFLKKSTKHKFSLLTLVFLSIFIIFLSNLNFKPIQKVKTILAEIVYRSSFVVSIPENLIKKAYLKTKEYSFFYKDYKKNINELNDLKSENISSEIIKSENKELKNLIEDYTLTTNKLLARVLVDRKSPFLKTIIINKGSSENIKLGTSIYDKNYLVGKVIEVNYKTSRVLLLSDLNSSIPVSITPGNIQAIVVGSGNNSGKIKYIKSNLVKNIKNKSIVYTSGTGSVFKSGVPVGKIDMIEDEISNIILVDFYSNFSQLKYVFAEVDIAKENTKSKLESAISNSELLNTERIKLDLLNDEVEIYKESNNKFIEENKDLKYEINQLIDQKKDLQIKMNLQSKTINQIEVDKKDLEFLKLNLLYSSKCQKTFFKQGYKINTQKYKDCILRKGKLND